MTSFDALLMALGFLSLAGAIAALRPRPSTIAMIFAIVLALASSGASMAITKSRHAGTGMSEQRGYPKPFHFRFTDEQGRRGDGDFHALYFAVNTAVHLGAWAVLAVLLPHRGDRASRIPGGMFILRIVLGVVFVVLGIAGSLLPVLQGWIFFLLAFLVLFPRTRLAQKILVKAEPKLPRVVAWLRKLE